MDYCQFFETEGCCAVVDGPGCGGPGVDNEHHPDECTCCAYAVVDLETAKDLLDFGEAGSPTCLIVTG